jgi:hypothetical protein
MPGDDWSRRKVYAVLGQDARGFALFTALSDDAPEAGDYLYLNATWSVVEDEQLARLELPFDRYYMEESKAPAAEKAYREATRGGAETAEAFVTVRVLDGLGVLEGLFVDGAQLGASAREAD